MKTLGIVLKILAALIALAGIAFVIIKYGDKIVLWVKKLFGRCDCDCECACECEGDCDNCLCEDDCDNCECEGCCNCEEAQSALQAVEDDFEG